KGDIEFLKDNKAALAFIDGNRKKGIIVIDPYNGRPISEEAYDSSKDAVKLFTKIVDYKEWKRKQMKTQGLDVNNAQDMMKVTISDYDKFLDRNLLKAIFGDIKKESK